MAFVDKVGLKRQKKEPTKEQKQPLGGTEIGGVIYSRVLFIGDDGIGKRSIINHMVGEEYTDQPDIGPRHIKECQMETVRADHVLVLFPNLSFTYSRYHSDRDNYQGLRHPFNREDTSRNLNAIVFVFDITDRPSFENIRQWHRECNQYGAISGNTKCFLVAAKTDLSEIRGPATNKQETEQLARELGMCFVETSAKESHNIEELKLAIARETCPGLYHSFGPATKSTQSAAVQKEAATNTDMSV